MTDDLQIHKSVLTLLIEDCRNASRHAEPHFHQWRPDRHLPTLLFLEKLLIAIEAEEQTSD